jgi:hypothetical protein
MRAGLIPAAEETDRVFLKVPINRFGGVSLNKLPKDKPPVASKGEQKLS